MNSVTEILLFEQFTTGILSGISDTDPRKYGQVDQLLAAIYDS